MRYINLLPIAGVLMAALAAVSPSARAGTEETIRAFSVWDSHGAFYVPGPEQSTFSATLIGRLYVDTEKGPVEAGMLSCPATVRIKTADRTQQGSAICAISTKDGAQVFAQLTCTGVYMVGCSGEAKITGGTGRFEGVTGGGKFTIRSDLAGAGGGAMNAQMMDGQAMPGTQMMNNGQMMNGQAAPGQMMNGQATPGQMMNGQMMPGQMNLPPLPFGRMMMGSMTDQSVGGILFFQELHYKVP